MSLLIFPLIFYLNRNVFTKVIVRRIIWVFCVSVVVFVLLQIIVSLFNIDYLLLDLTEKEIRRNNLSSLTTIEQNRINSIKIRRFRSFILKFGDTHFTYQGLWISFVIFVFLREAYLRFKKNLTHSIILLISASLLIIWLSLLSTRMPLLTVLIASFVTWLLFVKFEIKTFLILLITSILLSITSYFVFVPIKVRINEIFSTKFNLRNGIYYCSFKVIQKNILLGVGVGDSQSELNKCYENKIGAKIYKWMDYNTHNQYLFFLVSTGIGGLLLFLISIYIHLKKSITSRQAMYFYFSIIIILISMTENILVRSDGLMFYAFFGNLFLFNSKK